MIWLINIQQTSSMEYLSQKSILICKVGHVMSSQVLQKWEFNPIVVLKFEGRWVETQLRRAVHARDHFRLEKKRDLD